MGILEIRFVDTTKEVSIILRKCPNKIRISVPWYEKMMTKILGIILGFTKIILSKGFKIYENMNYLSTKHLPQDDA